jgi:hypothetical protein
MFKVDVVGASVISIVTTIWGGSKLKKLVNIRSDKLGRPPPATVSTVLPQPQHNPDDASINPTPNDATINPQPAI